MELEIAQKLQSGDIVLIRNKEWEVVDIMDIDDGIMISACRDEAYEIFTHDEISSKK